VAWVAEFERRARRVLSDPDGGEAWSAARAEIDKQDTKSENDP